MRKTSLPTPGTPGPSSTIDPYRPLFPLGWLAGLIGVGAWLPYWSGNLAFHPAQLHSETMTGVFLFLFAMGFLMTAVPRFSGSPPASRRELILATILGSVLLTLTSFNDRLPFHAASILTLFFGLSFVFRRLKARTHDPHPAFPFVSLGIILGLAGACILLIADWTNPSAKLLYMGRQMYFQGMLLCLVLGVGSRLIPGILGWANAPVIQISKPSASTPWTTMQRRVQIIVVALTLSFPLEAWLEPHLGRALRAVLITWMALAYWKIQRRPASKGYLAWSLWLAAWCLLVGSWFYTAASATYAPHAAHFIYLGGFGLMTLMIATRVTLAHGGFGLGYEVRSKAILSLTVLIVLALGLRLLAPLLPAEAQNPGLTLAASLWMAALMTWGLNFVPKLLPKKEKASAPITFKQVSNK